MGVRPVWANGSQRVDDFEILPVSLLDRPRVDVTLRVSGFFRDAFANLIRLFDAAQIKPQVSWGTSPEMVLAVDQNVPDPAQEADLFKRFFHLMLDGGVYLAPSAFEAGFTSIAHGETELQQIGRAHV